MIDATAIHKFIIILKWSCISSDRYSKHIIYKSCLYKNAIFHWLPLHFSKWLDQIYRYSLGTVRPMTVWCVVRKCLWPHTTHLQLRTMSSKPKTKDFVNPSSWMKFTALVLYNGISTSKAPFQLDLLLFTNILFIPFHYRVFPEQILHSEIYNVQFQLFPFNSVPTTDQMLFHKNTFDSSDCCQLVDVE